MTFPDDHSSPAAPFSGDETGEIFDTPDLVLQSPTTTERVVETQSGFLVVVRRSEERQALSVKRRLGTPPASSVLLTSDESLKLARILGDGTAAAVRKPLTRRAEEWLSAESTLAVLSRRESRSKTSVWTGIRGVILPLSLTLLLGVALAYMAQSLREPGSTGVAAAAADPLDKKSVEPFVRNFVSNMLDFNPESYRASQIRAMAAMTPELMETYWRDTRFPMNRKQLKGLPHESTVLISKIAAQRLDEKTATTDVYAQLVNDKSKLGSPLHLRIGLVLDGAGDLRISEQKDLTASAQ